MYMDNQLLFSDAQALTAAAASTNYIDLGGASRDVALGRPIYFNLNVDVALTDASSNSTVTVALEQDDNTSFSSATAIQTLCTIAATAAAGTVYRAVVAPGIITERYLRVYYTMNNGDLSTGTVTAGFVLDQGQWTAYADNITIEN